MHVRVPAPTQPRWLLAAALSSLLLAACGGGDSKILSERSGQVVVDGRTSGDLEGVWRILGEGTLMEFKSNSVARYQEAGALCYPQAGAAGGLRARMEFGCQGGWHATLAQ